MELVFQERDIDGLVELIASSDHIVTAVVSLPEAVCALARARRGGRLRAVDHGRAVKELQSSWLALARVSIDESVAQAAAQLGERLGLRGYDAIHLAVAVGAGRSMPVTMASWDKELLAAARVEGLATFPA